MWERRTVISKEQAWRIGGHLCNEGNMLFINTDTFKNRKEYTMHFLTEARIPMCGMI